MLRNCYVKKISKKCTREKTEEIRNDKAALGEKKYLKDRRAVRNGKIS